MNIGIPPSYNFGAMSPNNRSARAQFGQPSAYASTTIPDMNSSMMNMESFLNQNIGGAAPATMKFGMPQDTAMAVGFGQPPQSLLTMPNATASDVELAPVEPGLWNQYGSMAVGGANAIANLVGAYGSIKQLGLAEDQFEFQKEAWGKQYAAKKNEINSNLESRQNVRYRTRPDANVSPDEYMNKYGVK